MSKADVKFKEMCNDVLTNGTNTMGQKVRPHWEDGTPAYTIKQFGVCNTYDLREEFPALTLRKTALKSAMDEILWIFQKKSNNIHDLNSHIWDSWADENGSIGKAYGYQIGKVSPHCKFNCNDIITDEINEKIQFAKSLPSYQCYNINGKMVISLDQMDSVLYDLKFEPFSRRIITSTYNIDELSQMNLHPCAYSCTFNVTDEGKDKLVLNMVLNQRSQDILAANNWNTAQYAILLMMVAQCSNMIPGKLMHVIADAHIYDRHVDIIKELCNREEYPAPIVKLNPNITNFYEFTTNDLIVENYITGEQIKNIPIAI